MSEEGRSSSVTETDVARFEGNAGRFFGRLKISELSSSNWLTLELIIALLLVIVASIYAWPEIKGMATSSLWQDELYTIDRFSSRGPRYVMTNYNANNHIVFNILSSLTAGKHPFQPLSARFWSFICLILTVALTLFYYTAAHRPFDGGAQLFLFLANLPALNLALQARGYGFLAFAAVLCTVIVWQYFRQPSLMAFVALPLVVWLATWTVPTFVFFGGGLLLTMFVYTRDRRWLVSGVCALLAIVLAYWPVHKALLAGFSGYSKEWGKPFANWNAISDLLSKYLLFETASWVTFLIAILALITLSRKRVRDAKVKASVCAGCSTLIALVISLKMETPPLRTVAYLATPIAFIFVTVMTEPLREGTLQRFRLHMMTALLLAAFAFALQSGKKVHFRPIESWLETAHRIEEGFPKGTEVVARFRPKWLRVYLPGSYPIVQDLDVAKFRAGRQIVVDSSFWVKSRFPLNTLPRGYRVDTVPQRRGGGWIYSFPPANSSPQ